MKTGIAVAVALIAGVALTLTGCGGGDSIAPITPPANTPAVHSGYAVYLQGGSYDSSYLPQDAPDHFSVLPGAYKIVALKQAEVGTMSDGVVQTMGGIDWPATVYKHGTSQVVSPTPNGWVLGLGGYDADVNNPAGGTIRVTIEVKAVELDGYNVRMVAVDPSGKAYEKDADGHYQVEVWQPFKWAAVWSKNGVVVTAPSRYSAYASLVSGSEDITWLEGSYMAGKVVSRAAFAVIVYNNSAAQGDGGTTVDTTIVDFTPEITVGTEPGQG